MKIDLIRNGFHMPNPIFTYDFINESEQFQKDFKKYGVIQSITVTISHKDLIDLSEHCQNKEELASKLWIYQYKLDAKRELIDFVQQLREAEGVDF